MPLIVAEECIEHIMTDGSSLLEAYRRVEEAILANDSGWEGSANYTRLLLSNNRAYSLLSQVHPSQGGSLRVFPADGTDGAPRDGATWMLFDSDTGGMRAIFGAQLLSALRTAIPSVACARALATPECRSIAVIGSGRQAHAHCRVIRSAFPNAQTLHIWSPSPENRCKLGTSINGAI